MATRDCAEEGEGGEAVDSHSLVGAGGCYYWEGGVRRCEPAAGC